jgi:hypothetical protein
MLDYQTFETRVEATAAIADYVDAFYNVHRQNSSIGHVSPIEFEMRLSMQQNYVAA